MNSGFQNRLTNSHLNVSPMSKLKPKFGIQLGDEVNPISQFEDEYLFHINKSQLHNQKIYSPNLSFNNNQFIANEHFNRDTIGGDFACISENNIGIDEKSRLMKMRQANFQIHNKNIISGNKLIDMQ